MQYQINAWLEKIHPALQIIDKKNNQTIKEFNEIELQEMIESGELVPSELNDSNPGNISLLVEELLQRYYHPSHKTPSEFGQTSRPHRHLQGLIEQAKSF